MASVFTYDPDPPRVSSPWSTPDSSTPQLAVTGSKGVGVRSRSSASEHRADPNVLSDYGISKLEPEPQEGPTEYKLHLLLRPRRPYNSMTTGHVFAGSYHSRMSLSNSGPMPSSYESNSRQMSNPSTQSRQQRLQQLTTQLLWRLQQSSPFHSSTAANLVLPVLPEATSQLGVPQKPARLLPGLEESQGALYEIGVADDGTFVGLVQDELEESLANLQVMAASLGCRAEVLRRVIVGKCEWSEAMLSDQPDAIQSHTDDLWVAEALVSPDWDHYLLETPRDETSNKLPHSRAEKEEALSDGPSNTEQIRISITGPNAAGKSSLLGTLTSSVLDNGRGASRLGLLKHRHEISSGVTSSVAHEFIGYAASEGPEDPVEVINYASGNVAAWDDVHATAKGGRLAFVSDLPGSPRYLKSTLRGLIGWAPHYVFLCIPANGDEEATTGAEQQSDTTFALSYLELCLKFEIPTIVVITKMDLASRAGLRGTLTRVLSALKSSGKTPLILPGSEKAPDLHHIGLADAEEVKKATSTTDSWTTTVPIVLTSAVDGSGIGKLHAFMRYLPIPKKPSSRVIALPTTVSVPQTPSNVFDIDEVFAIPPSKVYSLSTGGGQKENNGVVLCGLVRYGAISIGDELVIGPLLSNQPSEQGSSPSGQRHRSERRSDVPGQGESLRSRPVSGELSSTFSQLSISGRLSASQAHWQRVRVVSVRNLRLPVQKLVEDQVGTIGIEPLPTDDDQSPRLGKIRRGTVLANFAISSTAVPGSLPSHTGFVATFSSTEFSSSLSPPLLLGGNAIVHIANIRSTVKVTCMALAENEIISSPPSPAEPEFFGFDSDIPERNEDKSEEVNSMVRSSDSSSVGDVKITFTFVNSVEWVELGSRVLLLPGASTALASAQNASSPTGLEGFYGRVCEVLTGGDTGNIRGSVH